MFGDHEDASIWRTVVREFFEEFLGKEELKHAATDGKRFADVIESGPLAPQFEALFGKNGLAKLYLLGVGIEPLTTKPDIVMAMVIDWSRALRRVDGLKRQPSFEGKSIMIDLTRDKLLEFATMVQAPGAPCVYPGTKAALLLCRKHLRALADL